MKKKKFIGLFALLPLWAQACITFVISCTVLIVGAVVIYELYQMTRSLNNIPPPQQANNVSDWASSWTTGFRDTNGNLYAQETGGYNPYWGRINYTNHAYAPGFALPGNNGYMLQYGLDATNAPWIVPGNGLDTNQAVYVQTLADTVSNYSVAFTMYGITTIYTASTNGDSGGKITIDATTNAVATNAWGDTVISRTNAPRQVVIERAMDFSGPWLPIFTNTVLAGTVQNYTDTNKPDAQTVKPNLVPPGPPGNTNVGPFEVTSVFYRLKYLNQ